MSWDRVQHEYELAELRRLSKAATPDDWPQRWDYYPLNRADPAAWWVGHATGPQVSGGREDSPEFRRMSEQIMADAAFQAACVSYVRNRVIGS